MSPDHLKPMRMAWLCVLLVAGLLGCAVPPVPPALRPLGPPRPSNVEVPFEQAVAQATDALLALVLSPPASGSAMAKRSVVVDPMLQATSGQQTTATQALERLVVARLSAQADAIKILPFQRVNLAKAQWLLTGTLTRGLANRPKDSLLVNLALTDLKTGIVAAQAWALTRDDGMNDDPLPYYADSPVLVRDRVIEGYVSTTATGTGKRADAYYLERIAAAALINDATLLYNDARYLDALAQYRAAGIAPGGQQLRALTGVYLASGKLARAAEAEQAFGKVVAYGIANNQLGVKFLFNPGSTVFWSDAKVSGPYAMWLRQIARESMVAKVCMSIVGHSSRTRVEAMNDALSLQRAGLIRQRLASEAAVLNGRTRTVGVGFRENIVGSGTDNAVDALDRRVEFKIVPCG